jgi:hypothetical protein
MQSIRAFISSIPHWFLIALASALAIGAASIRAFEPEDARRKRAEVRRQKELKALAEKISTYGHTVHEQFPTGEVVVSERDLAEQLRKRPEVVVTALNRLLSEQKVGRAPLSGYWKLNQ